MGIWFRQLLQEGLALAALVALLILLPWWPAKLLVAVVLAWIVLLYWRDPRAFYRRMFRLTVGAILAAPLSSFTLDLLAVGSTEAGSAAASLLAAFGVADPWPFVALAALCVAADFGLNWRERRREGEIAVVPDPAGIRFSAGAEGRIDFAGDVTIQNLSAQSLTIAGASLSITSVPYGLVDCELFEHDAELLGAPMRPAGAGQAVRLPVGSGRTLHLSGGLAPSWQGRLLALRARAPVALQWLAGLSGELRLAASSEDGRRPIPLRLRRG